MLWYSTLITYNLCKMKQYLKSSHAVAYVFQTHIKKLQNFSDYCKVIRRGSSLNWQRCSYARFLTWTCWHIAFYSRLWCVKTSLKPGYVNWCCQLDCLRVNTRHVGSIDSSFCQFIIAPQRLSAMFQNFSKYEDTKD